MTRQQRLLILLAVLAASPILLVLILWLSLLYSRDPFNHALAHFGTWPVACTWHGCVTTRNWQKQYQARILFSKTINQGEPSPQDALTTLIRQRLVSESFVASPVTMRDAARYREEILQAKDGSKIAESTGLTLDDYDRYVILPLLQQEVLRQERNIGDYNELFHQLAQKSSVWVLLSTFKWDIEKAKVLSL